MMLFTRLNLPALFIKVLCNSLKDRAIKIKINEYLGPSFGIEAGVAQGAPESPDIFNISTLPLGYRFNSHYTYSPWYCDDQVQIVATPFKSKFFHNSQLKNSIRVQNQFERTRGIITCVEKSIITPVSMIQLRNLVVNENNINSNYPIL